MVEKELGQRNFSFDSLKSRLNRNMEEKEIVARDYLPLSTVGYIYWQWAPPLPRRQGGFGAHDMEEAAEA